MAAEDLLERVGSMSLDDVGNELERLRKENDALKRKVTSLEVAEHGAVGEEARRASSPASFQPHHSARHLFPLSSLTRAFDQRVGSRALSFRPSQLSLFGCLDPARRHRRRAPRV